MLILDCYLSFAFDLYFITARFQIYYYDQKITVIIILNLLVLSVSTIFISKYDDTKNNSIRRNDKNGLPIREFLS